MSRVKLYRESRSFFGEHSRQLKILTDEEAAIRRLEIESRTEQEIRDFGRISFDEVCLSDVRLKDLDYQPLDKLIQLFQSEPDADLVKVAKPTPLR